MVSRYLALFFIFINFSFACTLCKLETPVVLVEVESYKKDSSRYFDIRWEFERDFSASTLLAYDINGDGTPQENELSEVKLSLEDYLKQNAYLTHIFIKEGENKKKITDFEIVLSEAGHKNYKIIYEYTIKTNIEINKLDFIELKFFDEKEFFDFVFKKFRFDDYKGLKTNRQKSSITKYFSNTTSEKIQQTQEIKEENDSSILGILKNTLNELKEYISELLTDIKDNNTLSSYFWLLLLSFAYGIIHALGPGHGKSLVASYFLSKEGSVFKALNISLMIGIVHTFSAFLLTFSIYYILKSVLSEYFTDVESMAIKFSAVVIILIALYLLAQKFKKPKIKSFSASPEQSFIKAQKPIEHINNSSCACNACKTNSTDIGVILAAGIIPCPGTITIFVFTFGLGIYFVGFLSAIWMSLGMSFIIFLAAYLSIKIKAKTSSNAKVKIFLEYASLVFILSLGIMLLAF